MICVVTFSVLALTTAYADFKLTKKVADKNMAYYQAEERAYAHISDVESALKDAYLSAVSTTAYYESLDAVVATMNGTLQQENGIFTYHFEEVISDTQCLVVGLELTYPMSADDTFLKIIEYKSVHIPTLPEDEILDLIN